MQRKLLVVFGSALLWSWGFLCYLSPIMIPTSSATESYGIEMGYFAAGISAALFAVLIVAVSHFRSITVRNSTIFTAAFAASVSAIIIALAPIDTVPGVVIACGLVDGIGITLLGIAWGTRYSLESRRIRPLVMLSFLIAYSLYFIVTSLPSRFGVVYLIVVPLISWALWRKDASERHEITSEVFPVRIPGKITSPGELLAGSWEASVLPWRSLSVIIVVAFVGNFALSVISGDSYAEAKSFSAGGIAVCACIAALALVLLSSKNTTFSPESVYRIIVMLSAIGLVSIIIFGNAGISLGGALVQGSAMFLQALTILVVTQSTQEQGISPLLAFSVGLGLVAGVVFMGNILGKALIEWFGSSWFIYDLVCGIGLLLLLFVLAVKASVSTISAAPYMHDENTLDSQKFAAQSPDVYIQNKIDSIVKSYVLTQREIEVLAYLAKGRTLPYIADELFVTTGTIKTHTLHIYRKLNVNSRQELLDILENWTENGS